METVRELALRRIIEAGEAENERLRLVAMAQEARRREGDQQAAPGQPIPEDMEPEEPKDS